ncbi:hypothetical protein LP090_08545 [Moraxella bovis]|uniref:hypothetical protein n=1 Tax=Moraxella bovis TaxID=476 RepID=UPI002225C0C7|nr:hypothetical protein [Moraxella bovis]UYZ69327.1 hypothetical protein LP122_04430 [Moraxella bovis]UYZ71699.1 hypothetical protein LP089_04480 [Moraxella bovis]UYZ72385.1 hypothetical protein LP105_08180 [Moraxella bovis]UZA14996.1 hypothetical protein LP102_04425 [Moraxella bovis]UZA26645.1 hypothetical protein LP119_08415 [Moraxella bovis]
MTRQTAHHQATHCTRPAIMTVIHDDKTRTISNDMIVQTLAKLTTPIKQTTPRRCVA